MLTIAYFTNRKNPRIRWFFDSLDLETRGNYEGIKVVVVDFFEPQRGFGIRDSLDVEMLGFGEDKRIEAGGGTCTHVPPKSTVWQGQHKLTSVDYFAASNARNTAIALAPDGYIAFVDDLSVLMPGWLAAVREAQRGGYIALGAYKKVKNLVVLHDGKTLGWEDYGPGVDSRWNAGRDDKPVTAAGSWMFGCSLAAPVEAFLKINGFDEDCDSMGSEDYIAGMMLERSGYQLKYDRRMFTLESEEAHHEEPPFKRIIKVHKGASPACKDSSHAILQAVMHGGRNVAPNYFGPEGLRGLRQRVLAGEPFPIVQIPQHDWRDGQPLTEM